MSMSVADWILLVLWGLVVVYASSPKLQDNMFQNAIEVNRQAQYGGFGVPVRHEKAKDKRS